jgi:hypothetical protein
MGRKPDTPHAKTIVSRDRGLHPMLAQSQLPEQQQEQRLITLGKIDIGLMRDNRDECNAALDWHFASEPPLTWQSNVSELDINPRIINAAQDHGIETLAQLRAAIWDGRFLAIPNMGPRQAEACLKAMAGIGQMIADWCI